MGFRMRCTSSTLRVKPGCHEQLRKVIGENEHPYLHVIVSGNARRLYVEIAGSNLSGYGEEKLYKEFEAIRPFVTGHLKLYADGGYYDTIQF